MKNLSQLVQNLPGLIGTSREDIPIHHIALDSREVRRGDIFVAFEGLSLDGHQYIPDAIQAGAAAIMGTQSLVLPVPYVQVEDESRCAGSSSRGFL